MRLRVLAVLVLAGAVSPAPALAQDPVEIPAAPNVVVIMTDDQTVSDMDVMPHTRRLVGAAGVTFLRSYVSYPLCCPSRATFLTGQYAHNNRVLCLYDHCDGGYGALRQDEYLPVWLRRANYTTAHIGKFLNGYGEPWDPVVPRGWDEWYGLVDMSTYRMWGYRMNENGRIETYGRVRSEKPSLYQTDVLRDKATAFIRRRSPDDDPFFLSVAFVAPHHETGHTQSLTGHLVRSAPRHRGTFANLPYQRPRSYNELDMTDKPWFFERWHRPITDQGHAQIVAHHRERRESLLAVDEAVRAIVKRLRESGELDSTYVIFTSDNGYMQGEHRIESGKMLPWEPSTRVPLLIRGPGLPRGRRTMALVGNVDLAPTILDATPARPGLRMDGISILPFARNVGLRSLRPLLHETGGQGSRGLLKREEGARGLQTRVPAWRAVRTTRWLFVDYRGGQRELYDLKRDPAQLQSLSAEPRYRTRLRTLRRVLGDLTDCAGRTCRAPAAASVR